MRIGPIGPPWAMSFLGAAFWAGMAALWAAGNGPSDIRPFAAIFAAGAAVFAVGRGVYLLLNPSKAATPRKEREEPNADEMIIYIVLACTVLFAVYTGSTLFIELGQMQR